MPIFHQLLQTQSSDRIASDECTSKVEWQSKLSEDLWYKETDATRKSHARGQGMDIPAGIEEGK